MPLSSPAVYVRTKNSLVLRMVAACLLLGLLASSSASDAAVRRRLPIIPGAAGFGMHTPAGSGRHLRDATLDSGWDKSLVHHWDFDDGKPGGTLEGDAALVVRGQGKALELGGGGHLSLAKAAGYAEPGGSFTIMAWVHMEKPLGSIAANAIDDSGNWDLSHVRHGSGKWMLGAKGEQGQAAAYWTREVDEPKWQHVAGVYDGETGDLSLYINAIRVAGTRGRGVKGLAAAKTSNLTVGKGVSGLIDDVMFFGAPLTQDEIVALYACRHDAYLGSNRTRVIKVTNLNTEGPGSLRAALDAVGPRVVVFEVGGNIDFSPFGGLSIRNPYVTVAGQTAPSPGITLKAGNLTISTHDVLLQHLRVRVGDLADPNRPLMNKAGWSQWSERDCMAIGGRRIVIDHCSVSWSTDELVQSRASEITFRHCIFGECLDSYKHHKGGHSKALLILDQGSSDTNDLNSRHVDIVGNLFAFNADRCPQASGGAKLVVVNNLIYDMMCKPAVGVTLIDAPKSGNRGGPIVASVVGNYFDKVPGPIKIIARDPSHGGEIYLGEQTVAYTPAEWWAMEAIMQTPLDDDQMPDYRGQPKDMSHLNQDVVIRDRIADPWNAPHMCIFKRWCGKDIDPLYTRRDKPPIEVPGLQVRPSSEVRDWVLRNAGARPADRDPVDARIVKQVRGRTGRIIQTQDDVGGWPDLAETKRELTVPENPSGDDDGDGYTNLEEWLHGFASEVERERR